MRPLSFGGRARLRTLACLLLVATLATACSSSGSPGASGPVAAASTPGAAAATPITLPRSYPPLPSPTPLPPAAPAGALSSIKATRIPLGYPLELSAVGQTVWAQTGSRLARFDVATNRGQLVDPNTGGDGLDNLLATDTAIWLADFDGHQLVRLDPATGKNVAQISVGAAEDVIDVGGTLWVTNHHEGTVSRIDPTTNAVIDTITVGIAGTNGPQQLAEGAGSVWVGESNNHTVIRLDPATGHIIQAIAVPDAFQPCGGILATDTAVWVTGCHEVPELLRIDPKTNAVVTTIALDGYAQDPVLIGGSVWVAVAGVTDARELERINPTTNKVDRKIDVPGLTDVFGAAIAGGDLWVSNATDAIFRFPLTELGGP